MSGKRLRGDIPIGKQIKRDRGDTSPALVSCNALDDKIAELERLVEEDDDESEGEDEEEDEEELNPAKKFKKSSIIFQSDPPKRVKATGNVLIETDAGGNLIRLTSTIEGK